MDSVESTDSPLFTQDENHRVVAKATTWVDWYGGGLIHHKHVTIVHQNLQGFSDHRGLVAVHRVLHVVVVLRRESGEIRSFLNQKKKKKQDPGPKTTNRSLQMRSKCVIPFSYL